MTLDIRSIRLRLDLIFNYLDEMRPLTLISLEEFINDRYKILAAERLLEITIQAAIDINNHLIKELFKLESESYANTFEELARHNVLDLDLAKALAESAKFRNRLAHRYYEIDAEIVFYSLSKTLDLYPLYIQKVENHIDTLNR